MFNVARIEDTAGKYVNGNLFHSFSTFNIGSTEGVDFVSGQAVNNVISRVTGGASSIDGLLRSSIAGANFYFINPAGVTFGANAVVDVPAAFNVSTADRINAGVGVFYSATDITNSSTFSAAPESFGFLSTNSTGTIGFDGSQITLNQSPQQTLDVVASNITVANNAKLVVPAGEVRLVAMKGNNDVSLVRDGNGFLPLPVQTPIVENAGNVLVDNSLITTQGNGGGRLTLWAGDAIFNQSMFNANNDGNSDASAGKGIEINANNFTTIGYSGDLTTGNNLGWISSDSIGGKTGGINLTAKNLNIFDSGQISADTYTLAHGGNVNINAQTLKIDGGDVTSFTGISAGTYNNGNAGNINVVADTIDISTVGAIQSATIGDGNIGHTFIGNAGNIIVSAKNFTIDGHNNYLITGIQAYTLTSGNGGSVYVKTDSLQLLNAGTILGDSVFSNGKAGNITVEADSIKIDGQGSLWWTGIVSDVIKGGRGQAGLIKVNTGTLEILNGGRISSASCNGDCQSISSPITNGIPGDIIINASQSIHLANQAKISTENSGTLTNPATVKAGVITISSPDIVMQNSSITTKSTGNVDAGDININFSHWLTMDPSFIMTTANTGNGGDIRINGGQLIYLKDSGFLTSVSGANSNGGNIFVNADFLIMDTGVIQANAIGGFGGDINLRLNGLIASYDNLILGGSWVNWQPFVPGFNVIQAASETGVSGNVNITSPQFNISGSVSGLEPAVLTVPDINRNLCQNMIGSSLKRSGKGGLPINEEKDDFIPAAKPLNATATESNPPSQTSQTTGGESCAASSI